MKKLALIAGVALLASCGSKEPAPEAAATADATMPMDAGSASAAPDAVAMEIDGKPMAGTFDITSGDGKRTMKQTVNDDGSVTSVMDGKTVKGTWTSTGPGKFCITNEGEKEPSCYTETMNPDGTMKTVNDKNPKDEWMVKRVA